MADGKHTPGPWEYSGGGIWGASPFGARVRLADITFHNSINAIDGNANGALIASAPDLLAALVGLADNIARLDEEGLAEHAEPMRAARAAIAKATGET